MPSPPKLLSEIPFGSFLVYSPRPRSDLSRQFKDFVLAVKQDKPAPWSNATEPAIDFAARRLRETLSPGDLLSFFGPQVTLVPTPGSAPLQKGGLWVALRICEALRREGLCRDVLDCLKRQKVVQKSAGSSTRPRAQAHYESLSVEPVMVPPDEITIVDDVVTRGATMLAAATRVNEAFPQIPVRGFALIRTISDRDVQKMLDPCTGTIRLSGDECYRIP